jgi:integrase
MSRSASARTSTTLDDGPNTELASRSRKLASSVADEGQRQKTECPNKNDPEAVRRRRASANRTLVILKAALNSAWRAGKIHSDQAWRRVAPFKEADAARARYLAVAEAKRLVDSSAPDFRRLVQAALVTGARYGELASLRASDFNADSGTVHVRTSQSGKGRHIVLGDEGVAVVKSFAVGKSGEGACSQGATVRRGPSHFRPDRWPKPVSARKLNLRFRFTFSDIPGPPLR